MNEKDRVADAFEQHRGRLRALAYRMLGSISEAEDAVQETWLRLARVDGTGIDNIGGWLTTVVARICLDTLRQRKSRREEPMSPHVPEPATASATEEEIRLADSIGLALLIVLEKLNPAERVAFVLHDMFDLPFEEIATIVGRSPAAARQLASRARRRVQGAQPQTDMDISRQRQIVEAFLAASRDGDLAGLLAVLDPDVIFRADATAVRMGGRPEMRGAEAVAATFKGRAQAAKPALIDGTPGLAVIFKGVLRIALRLGIVDGRIAAIDAVADPEHLKALGITLLD